MNIISEIYGREACPKESCPNCCCQLHMAGFSEIFLFEKLSEGWMSEWLARWLVPTDIKDWPSQSNKHMPICRAGEIVIGANSLIFPSNLS